MLLINGNQTREISDQKFVDFFELNGFVDEATYLANPKLPFKEAKALAREQAKQGKTQTEIED